MANISYNYNSEHIEFVVRDGSGRKIETNSCSVRDKKKYAAILNYLKDKYGFEPFIDPSESVNAREKKASGTPDSIDWFA